MDQLTELWNDLPKWVHIASQIVIWIFFVMLLAWGIKRIINRNISDNAGRYRAKKALNFVAFFLAVLPIIIALTGRWEYFSVALGFISAGIAFALQEVLLSIAGWVVIITANTFKTGDRVEINEVRGDVIDIGVLKTTLMEIGQWVNSDNYTGRIVQISNAFVFKRPVYNYSRNFPFLWDEVVIPVKYGSDTRQAMKILKDIANDLQGDYVSFAKEQWENMVRHYLIENATIAPTVSMKMTDNWMEFTLRYIVDYKKRRATQTEIYSLILERFKAANISLGSTTIEVIEFPEVKYTAKG